MCIGNSGDEKVQFNVKYGELKYYVVSKPLLQVNFLSIISRAKIKPSVHFYNLALQSLRSSILFCICSNCEILDELKKLKCLLS